MSDDIFDINMNEETKYVTCFVCLYLYVTLGEWFIHKHIMHNEEFDPGHIRHHKSVNIDMTLSEDDFMEEDIRMGSEHTIMITLSTVCVSNAIINKMFGLGVNHKYILLGGLALAIFYRTMWNTYHRKMHFESEFFENTNNPYLKWIFTNHSLHHLQKGVLKGNYNILFPGGDHLMGDYRTSVDNTVYCYEDKSHKMCEYKKIFSEIPKRKKM